MLKFLYVPFFFLILGSGKKFKLGMLIIKHLGGKRCKIKVFKVSLRDVCVEANLDYIKVCSKIPPNKTQLLS